MLREKIQVDRSFHGSRLDQFLAQKMAGKISRSQIKKNIESGLITIGGKKVSAHYKVKSGEEIELEWTPKENEDVRAEDIPLDILYEDDDLILVNKPAGMVVHPAHANPDHTLVNALLYHFKFLSRAGGDTRPGIVHRLDKDTSGIILIAKNDQVHESLAKQFKNHTIQKNYYAVVKGVMQHDEGSCIEPVGRSFLNRKKVIVKASGGKEAETFYRVKERFHDATLVEVFPRTGRTHQIRVHMMHLDHPLLGDSFYGTASPFIRRQALHAYALTFHHPTAHAKMHFEAPLPADMESLLKHLREETA